MTVSPDRLPRLPMDKLRPDLAEHLGPRVKRLGYLGEFFQCGGHQPGVLLPFMEMTEALKKALPDKLTETIALTVATRLGNAYERHQHERLSDKLGFGHDWIKAVLLCAPDTAPHLSDHERKVQKLVIAALATMGQGNQAEFDAVLDAIGHEQAVAVLFTIGRYATHALIVNTLELAPPVPSVFAEGK